MWLPLSVSLAPCRLVQAVQYHLLQPWRRYWDFHCRLQGGHGRSIQGRRPVAQTQVWKGDNFVFFIQSWESRSDLSSNSAVGYLGQNVLFCAPVTVNSPNFSKGMKLRDFSSSFILSFLSSLISPVFHNEYFYWHSADFEKQVFYFEVGFL